MKITVLGSADMSSRFMSSSFLIDEKILVDAPDGICREMRRNKIEPMKVDHVLITHIHGDHVLGLPIWALLKTKQPDMLQANGIHIYAGELVDNLKKLLLLVFPTSFTPEKARNLVWHEEDEFSCEHLNISRVKVQHGVLPNCCGYLVSDGSHTIGFTGDSCLMDAIHELAAASEILFCDCDRIQGNAKHMGINDLIQLKKQYPKCRIIATHLANATREALKQKPQPEFEVAQDGIVIEI